MQETAATARLTQFSPAHLRSIGLRPTRQRQLLATLLFGKGDRHITAEAIFEEAKSLGHQISLATIYNNLKIFQNAGLLREILIGGGKVFFDTNTSSHHHYLVEDDNSLIDIPEGSIAVACSHSLPAGFQVMRVDVVIRARAGRCLGCSRLAECISANSAEATCAPEA
ncbi:iron response transcriptional regulator IrrA [Rhizobium sp. BT-175]|uniref:iron response transcriptional regulator IrrA n=1 Tax=Rhizobium sp. BT-175 TaxID=2986929 RepID=UPI002235EAC4|nr:Fur family transcriptional regulator [Rhizobium sp. BT-175]MCV9947652.1 transcriptional repressor [Rhizobium sp. BT-175]